MGGQVEDIHWDAGTNNGQWDKFVAPAIEGYTAVNSPVAAEKVTIDTKDTAVHITYKKNGNPTNPGDGGQKTTPTSQPTTPNEPTTPQVKPETTPTENTPVTPKPTVNAPVPHGEKSVTPSKHNNTVAPHGQNGPVNKVAAPHGEMGPVVKHAVSYKGTVVPEAQVVPNKKDSNTAHQLFQQGNLDDAQITGTTAQGMQNDKNLKHLHRAGVYYLQLNMRKNCVFSNAKMRHALNLVLDKKQLARKVLADGSTPADTFVAPTLAKDQSTGVDFAKEMKPEETHNVAKAQKLWNEGLKEEGRKKADLTYYTYDQTINKNIAQFVQSQVETKLKNAKVEIHAVPAKNVQDNVMRGNFDMYLSLWLADYTDPMSDMDVLQSNNY